MDECVVCVIDGRNPPLKSATEIEGFGFCREHAKEAIAWLLFGPED